MSERTCSVDGCAKRHKARGWCDEHYTQWRKHGDPLIRKRIVNRGTPEERLWARVVKGGGPSGDCWLWTGSENGVGYGLIRIAKKHTLTHRFSYELAKGPIPEGLVLDHLCRMPACCNPDHLEAVTHRVNTLRGLSPSSFQAKQTHCIHGHPLSGDNVYVRNGHRSCRTCHRLAERARYRRRKAS